MPTQTDVIIVGGGLAGLVAAAEVADAGKRAIIVEQEGEQKSRRASVLVAWRPIPCEYA